MKISSVPIFGLLLSSLVFAGDELPPPTGRLVDYSEVQAIFDKRCVECHEGDAAPNNLLLTDVRSYNLIFDEAAQQVPSLKRVKPGNAAQSYLFQKVNTSTPKVGARMPIGFTLPVEEQVAIRDWINQGALPVNRNPVIASGPTLSNAIPRAGEAIRLSAEASDPNGDPLTYAWDFGDGSTAQGNPVVHTFATAGTFTITLTVKDNRTGERIATLDAAVIPDLDTDADGLPNLADPDDDNDGFTDGIETAQQTNPLDAASTPLGGSSAATSALTVAQFKAKLDFKKSANDGLATKFTLTLPNGFTTLAQQVALDLGGAVRVVTLDTKGSTPSGAVDGVKLKLKKSKSGGVSGDLSVKLKAATLADAILGLELAAKTETDESASRTFSVVLNGTAHTAAIPLSYKRRKAGPGALALQK